MSVNRHGNRWRYKCDRLKYREDHNRNAALCGMQKQSGTSNNRGNRNNLQIIQKISEQFKWKARRQQSTENSHTGLCAHTEDSINVKYTTFIMGNNITCTIYCNHRIVPTLYTLETRFVSLYSCKHPVYR